MINGLTEMYGVLFNSQYSLANVVQGNKMALGQQPAVYDLTTVDTTRAQNNPAAIEAIIDNATANNSASARRIVGINAQGAVYNRGMKDTVKEGVYSTRPTTSILVNILI